VTIAIESAETGGRPAERLPALRGRCDAQRHRWPLQPVGSASPTVCPDSQAQTVDQSLTGTPSNMKASRALASRGIILFARLSKSSKNRSQRLINGIASAAHNPVGAWGPGSAGALFLRQSGRWPFYERREGQRRTEGRLLTGRCHATHQATFLDHRDGVGRPQVASALAGSELAGSVLYGSCGALRVHLALAGLCGACWQVLRSRLTLR